MSPKIRHIAHRSEDQEKTAEFYKKTFGMVEVWRHTSAEDPNIYGLYLSDGYMNVAVLKARPGFPAGLHHFGFQVDSIEEIAKLAEQNGAQELPVAMPKDGRFAEAALKDPGGVRVDVAVDGWRTEPAFNPDWPGHQDAKP